MRATAFLLSLCTIVVYTGNIWAQEIGSRVRVRDGTTEVIGTLVRLGTDSIVLRSDVRVYTQGKLVHEVIGIPVTADTKLDMSMGRRSKGLTGGLIGFGLGALLFGYPFAGFVESYGEGTGAVVAAFVVPSGLGALIGYAFGSASTSESWAEVSLDLPPRGDPYEVTEGMVRLGLRIKF